MTGGQSGRGDTDRADKRRRVQRALARLRPVVEEALTDAVKTSPSEQLSNASRHLLDAGGKRLRPAILLLAAETLADSHIRGTETGVTATRETDDETTPTPDGPADYRQFPVVGGGRVDMLTAATCMEVVHTFSLIHDDILDDDDVRRGVPTVHRRYGDDIAILAGDWLFARAFELLLETGTPSRNAVPALGTLARTCVSLCEGEALDIAFEQTGAADVSVDEYMRMVDLKTGVLFSATASLPAVLMGHQKAVDPLADYGREIGRAFQIKDDLLDLTASTEALGKQRGSDLVEGKQTLVTVHAREQGVDVDSLLDAETTEAATEDEIDEAVQRLTDAGSIAHAREMARGCIERGREHLSSLPETKPRQLLTDLSEYLVEREY